MLDANTPSRSRLRDQLATDYEYLDAGCRSVGITARMFRSFKFIFYNATLAVTIYLIQYAAVEPTLAMAFAILLIAGPEGLETWLIHRGQLDADERREQ